MPKASVVTPALLLTCTAPRVAPVPVPAARVVKLKPEASKRSAAPKSVTVSVPVEPAVMTKLSMPAPPARVSLPLPPTRVSWPAPVLISSAVVATALLTRSLPLPVCTSRRSTLEKLLPLTVTAVALAGLVQLMAAVAPLQLA